MIRFATLWEAIALLQSDPHTTLLTVFSRLGSCTLVLGLWSCPLAHLDTPNTTIIGRGKAGISRYSLFAMSIT